MTKQEIDGKVVRSLIICSEKSDIAIEFTQTKVLIKKQLSKVVHIIELAELEKIEEEKYDEKIKPIDLKTKEIDLTMLLDHSLSPVP